MDSDTRSNLELVKSQLTDVLRGHFESEQLDSSPASIRSGFHGSRLIDIDVVGEPSPGLLVSVRHWSVPHGRVLDIFVPAYGADDDIGVLDSDPETPSEFSVLPTVYILEELETRGFEERWSEAADGHLFVTLYS